jgi:hypothetical protein
VLDDFDEARNTFEYNAEAFRELRNLGYNSAQYGIAFVTISRRSIREIEIQSKASSTFDGIFGKQYLTMYNEKELSEYYQLYEDIGLKFRNDQKERLGYYCGGHPYLLALLGFEIVETFKESQELDIDVIFKKIRLQFADYYEQLIALLRQDKTFTHLLQIVFGPRIDVRPADIEELLVYGLIRKREKNFAAFSQHFHNYLSTRENIGEIIENE